MPEMEQNECPRCGGSGFVFEMDAQGARAAKRCVCQLARRNARALSHARIPRRYEHCTLESYETQFSGANKSLQKGLMTARKFVESYPLETDGKGILLTGSIGVGKTHLAVGILQALIERGAQGMFFDYRELLKQIQHSYNDSVTTTEMGILEPIFNAEVLVLDEIGASKPTDWVWDTVSHILNTRYNDKRTTILTTNYANLPPLGMETNGAQGRGYREDTLGDRIGERMRSRLQEMCVVVEMQGEDFRQRVKRATFA
ncbi:MAG: ATP-binding protein [Acidobacteria bacterium]|nr:ATP-binding protein [Acidobacteriota bacterium]